MTKPAWPVLLWHIKRTTNPKYNLWTSYITLYVQRDVINSYLLTLKDEIIGKKKSGDMIVFQAISVLSLDNLFFFFNVLLTVHLNIIVDNDQLDAHLLYFTIRLLYS